VKPYARASSPDENEPPLRRSIHHVQPEDAELGDETYDKVFAVHVAALHKPGRPLDVVRERLALSGRLYLLNQAPGWRRLADARRFGEALGEALGRAGFTIDQVLAEEVGGSVVSAVVARPAS
jgi:hypothetical protein